jgi:hypothetical protein
VKLGVSYGTPAVQSSSELHLMLLTLFIGSLGSLSSHLSSPHSFTLRLMPGVAFAILTAATAKSVVLWVWHCVVQFTDILEECTQHSSCLACLQP